MPKTSIKTDDNASPRRYEIYDEMVCACGESPLWHPIKEQLYWVDVSHHKILTQENGKTIEIHFGEFVTALGWIDENHLIAATETGLFTLNLSDLTRTLICSLESENEATRSNDGRTDPWGGFWISTMGKNAEEDAGKIYRYYKGEISVVVPSITIPNTICFDRNRCRAYFSDTMTQMLYVFDLDAESGVPIGKPRLFKDFSISNDGIDGAVVDMDGNLWIGVWNGENVIKLSPEKDILDLYQTGADRPTCPAFGGPNHQDLYVTTAAIGLENTHNRVPEQGRTLIFKDIVKGHPAPRFALSECFDI